jgi:hypothetical protein
MRAGAAHARRIIAKTRVAVRLRGKARGCDRGGPARKGMMQKPCQTVRKLGLSGFLRGVDDVRIAHGSYRRIRTRPASVVAGGG